VKGFEIGIPVNRVNLEGANDVKAKSEIERKPSLISAAVENYAYMTN